MMDSAACGVPSRSPCLVHGIQHLAKGNISVSRLRRMALLSLALPPDLAGSDFDAMVSGLGALAVRHRLYR